jgi:hypothetical protein
LANKCPLVRAATRSPSTSVARFPAVGRVGIGAAGPVGGRSASRATTSSRGSFGLARRFSSVAAVSILQRDQYGRTIDCSAHRLALPLRSVRRWSLGHDG